MYHFGSISFLWAFIILSFGSHCHAQCLMGGGANVQNIEPSQSFLPNVSNLVKCNSAYNDFAPTFYKDKLVFSSQRLTRPYNVNVEEFSESPSTFYEVQEGSKITFFKPLKARKNLFGSIAFNVDYSELLFTTYQKIKGEGYSWLSGRTFIWNILLGKVVLALPFNSDTYVVSSACFSKDCQKVFFSSNLPGGFGGLDLYVSYLENGIYSPPVNLGPTVNTDGNEIYPFIHSDGTLYFSSDGHLGYGLFDIYSSRLMDSSLIRWQTPVNLGLPINSPANDHGFVLNEDKTMGYFSSRREGGLGLLDLYVAER